MAKGCTRYLPAKMDKRLTLQVATEVSDDQGGQTVTWAAVNDVYAYIRPMKGYERFQAQQMETPVTHKITIRYQAGITTKHRFLFGSRIFDIKEVLNIDEADFFLEIKALERQT